MIDLSTFRRIPWENNVPFFLVSFFDPETKTPLSVDPRGVLKRVVGIGQDLGYECYSGVEYEVRGCQSLSLLWLNPSPSTSISKVEWILIGLQAVTYLCYFQRLRNR